MKIEKIFDRCIKFLSLIMLLWIILLLVFFENKIDYSAKRGFLLSNFVIVIIGLSLIIIQKFLKFKIKEINYDKIVKILCPIFLVVQIYIFYHTYFETGWDPRLLISNARSIINGQGVVSLDYYSMYPNNILYTLIAALILKINSFFGLFGNDYDLISIVFINCIISSFSSYLVYKIGKQLFDKRIAFFGYIVAVLLFVFSPWNIICYSDSFSIFIPILILYIYINKKIKYYYKFPLIVLLSYLGFSIKPHTVIIAIAIVIIEIIKCISNINKNKIKKFGIISIISITIVLNINTSLNILYSKKGFILNEEAKFGYMHFLMMGSNWERNGIYYAPDVDFSAKQRTTKIRNEQNFKVFIKRIKSYGVDGYYYFLSKKILTLYNDGSYAWMGEGDFFAGLKPETTKISKPLREIYYGYNYKYYSTTMQFIWINVLLIIFINSVIVFFKKQKIDYIYLVVLLSIIGITLFELLFEVRARYLYTSVPIFIVLMMYGLNNITKKT